MLSLMHFLCAYNKCTSRPSLE